MAGVIMSRTTTGLPSGMNAKIGKFRDPIFMIVSAESDALSKKKGVVDWLYNVEDSNAYAESIVTENSYGPLHPTEEGGRKELMSRRETLEHNIIHYEYSGKIITTKALMEDSLGRSGIPAQTKQESKRFVSSYYLTRNLLATDALTHGLSTSFLFGGKRIPTATADGLPLFSKNHTFGLDGDTQANAYYNTRTAGTKIDASMAAEVLMNLVVKMRNMKDENGRPLGFTADTLVIPANTPAWERAIKQACGSMLTSNATGQASNDINIQFGNWTIITMPTWLIDDPARCPVFIMSSDANEQLLGNVFFDRTKFEVNDYVDHDTSNYIITGRTRIGIGFGTYKHIGFFESLANGTTTLFDGQTAANVAAAITI